ncbi:hypothetical protein BJX61DRAFT_503384 [Aspergillus egyptiacus]|nr:hypothetical protein BJX61DRAFT_503384 [Aspergillus egyptiacus]
MTNQDGQLSCINLISFFLFSFFFLSSNFYYFYFYFSSLFNLTPLVSAWIASTQSAMLPCLFLFRLLLPAPAEDVSPWSDQ